MKAVRRSLPVSLLLAASALLQGCESNSGITEPHGVAPQYARGGDGGGGTVLVADVIDDWPMPPDYTAISSDNPGLVSTAGWHMDWEQNGGLVIVPDWNAASGYAPYDFADDVFIGVDKDPGKNGTINRIRLRVHDAVDGMMHDTDWLDVVPVVPSSKKPYDIEVYADGVEVWRHDGPTVGNRVAIIGWISIGRISVRPQ